MYINSNIHNSLINYVLGNRDYLVDVFKNDKLDFFQNNEIWVFYLRHTSIGVDKLANSFCNDLDKLEYRLENILHKSLDALNSEYYTLINNKIKLLFLDGLKDSMFNTNYIDYSTLDAYELKYALETFSDMLTDPNILGENESRSVFSTFSPELLEHPAFKELMSMSFFRAEDFENWGVIISNHLLAIQKIKNSDIPLYTGSLVDINDSDVLLLNDVNFDNRPVDIDVTLTTYSQVDVMESGPSLVGSNESTLQSTLPSLHTDLPNLEPTIGEDRGSPSDIG